MLLGFSFILFINFFKINIQWFDLSLEVFLLQSLIFYYLYRLLVIINLYQLVGYSTLVLGLFAIYLFWLQFDVFACFLLVAELVVMLFVLSLLMHLNYTNLTKINVTKTLLFIPFFSLFFSQFSSTNNFTYWVDWYSSQLSQYNDLLPQYLFFYLVDSPLVVLVGVWLLILTFLLVQIILSISFNRQVSNTTISYTRRTQNIWSQWYKKPIVRFFQK